MSSEIPPYRPLHRKASQEGRDMENIVQCYEKKTPKNVCKKFHENILNGSQKVDVIFENRPQNTLK